jgi:hypothetical protein
MTLIEEKIGWFVFFKSVNQWLKKNLLPLMARTHKHLWPKVTSLGNLMQAANLASHRWIFFRMGAGMCEPLRSTGGGW